MRRIERVWVRPLQPAKPRFARNRSSTSSQGVREGERVVVLFDGTIYNYQLQTFPRLEEDRPISRSQLLHLNQVSRDRLSTQWAFSCFILEYVALIDLSL